MESGTTHEVTNQPPPYEGHNVFTQDVVLKEAFVREAPGRSDSDLRELGSMAGSVAAQRWGDEANANPPVLRTHDRFGHRVDVVDYHPAYHELMRTAIGHGLHAAPWADSTPGSHVERAAKMIVWSTVDAGHTCPISMTYSVVPPLRHARDLAADWEPKLASRDYDPVPAPLAAKSGVTCGMAMTEKQGGSDLRANTTLAEPLDGGSFALTGHKWFCSAPMSDAFLTLARAPGGLSCFLLPRVLPDGTPNVFRIQRLKDKLGDRSNASSEIEFDRSLAWPVGDEGRGVATIIEMVNRTRLDCSLGSAAIMRHGTARAIHHATHRSAFGALLADQPLMVNVLADLALESEAATSAALRLAGAYDRGGTGAGEADVDERELLLARLATPVVKYWTCKRAPTHAAEALECLGGNGYVEESGMPRSFRQSPVNGVWEGSGNVICLDVLRAIRRSPESVAVFLDELDAAAGADSRYDTAVESVRTEIKELGGESTPDAGARRLVERLALCFQASLLIRHAPAAVSDAFCASRLERDAGVAFGTLPAGVDTATIVERAAPQPA